jgi:hypothetical protein
LDIFNNSKKEMDFFAYLKSIYHEKTARNIEKKILTNDLIEEGSYYQLHEKKRHAPEWLTKDKCIAFYRIDILPLCETDREAARKAIATRCWPEDVREKVEHAISLHSGCTEINV